MKPTFILFRGSPWGRRGRPGAGSLHNVGYVKAGTRGASWARACSLIAGSVTVGPSLIMTSLSDSPSGASTRTWSGRAGDLNQWPKALLIHPFIPAGRTAVILPAASGPFALRDDTSGGFL